LSARVDLGAVADEAKHVGMREAHPVPPLVASPDVEAMVAKLEVAGFRFEGSSGLAAATAGSAKEGAGFGAVNRQTERMARRRSLTTADQLAAVVGGISEVRASDADLQYVPSSETLYASFTVDVPHIGAARMIVEAHVADDAFERYAKIRAGADRVVADLERKADSEFESLDYATKAERLLLGGVNLGDFAALPTRMMERDATRRALRWLRQVRDKTGVNLLVPHLVQPERIVSAQRMAQEECVESTAGGLASGEEGAVEITILDDLRRALEGYGAARMRFKPPDDDEHPGITPIAGPERLPPEKEKK
jgi:hypothetical protein